MVRPKKFIVLVALLAVLPGATAALVTADYDLSSELTGGTRAKSWAESFLATIEGDLAVTNGLWIGGHVNGSPTILGTARTPDYVSSLLNATSVKPNLGFVFSGDPGSGITDLILRTQYFSLASVPVPELSTVLVAEPASRIINVVQGTEVLKPTPTSIPEPGTLALMALGFLALSLGVRGRNYAAPERLGEL